VTKTFLVSHFHRPHHGYQKFLIQLVDPETGVRLDIFPDLLNALSRASTTHIAGIAFKVLELDDILDHKLLMLRRSSTAHPVHPKHYQDVKRLAAACHRRIPRIGPSRLAATPNSRNVDEPCLRCEASRCMSFPLADKQRILDILGYT
jgi:hypothetical protein